jgi:internalin A
MVQQSPQIFLSYASADMTIKDELVRYLASTLGESLALSFGEGRMWMIDPKEQMNLISRAEIVIILSSQHYLKSPEINNEVLPFILKNTKSNSRLLPIMVDENDWKRKPYSKDPTFPLRQPINQFKDRSIAYEQIGRAVLSITDLLRNSDARDTIQAEKQARKGSMDLSNCSLSYMPVDLLEMPWLKAINFKNNLLSKIEYLDELAVLEYLELDNNQISTIENLDHLHELKELRLSGNQLTEVEQMPKLEQLERLELKHNKLESIKNIGVLPELKVLGLSSNQLKSLEGIEKLQKLEILYAAHNQLKEIEELKLLPLLTRVVLTNNQVRSLKPLLAHIKAGLKVAYEYSFSEDEHGIFVKDNTSLNQPSIETIQSGRDAILKYFEDVDQYGVQKLEVFKLVLVGNSRVGKTNLSQFLRKKKVELNSRSTHLLDIQGWNAPFLVSEKNTLTHIKIFDFGGQDYYHDSHRMYYSHDTAYLLLWDKSSNKYAEEADVHPKTGETILYENFPLEYWLESISYNIEKKELPVFKDAQGNDVKRPSGKTAPVLVIQNKIDLGEAMLDQKRLVDKYANIWGFYSFSLYSKKRTAILPEVLSDYLYALDLSGRLLVKFDIAIVQHFMSSKEALRILSLDEFWQLCITIINDDEVEYNRENAIIIAQTLSNIGVILFEKTAEKEGIIYTNIQELNQLVKDVMEVAREGNDKGIFNRSQLRRVEHRDAIIELLLRNNSIIRINDNEFLAPQFLPTTPDPSIHFFLHSFSHTNMRFVYKAYFHKTLLLNLFSKYLQGEHIDTSAGVKSFPFWRNGIIVKKGDEASGTVQMVLVEFEKNAAMGMVNIRTMRPFSRTGLEWEIEQTLDELNKGWSVDKQVSADSKHFFDVDELKRGAGNSKFSFLHEPSVFNTEKAIWEKINQLTEAAKKSGKAADIPKKYFSVNDFKHVVQFDKLPKKLFISYSSRNAEFIKQFNVHLEVLKANGTIDPWYDRMIESGTRWDDAIRQEMQRSDLVIFMLSPEFLATQYIMKEEIPLAIQLFGNSGRFFFVQLLPCNWEKTRLVEFQQTDNSTKAAKNVISIGTPENHEAWMELIRELEIKLDQIATI